MQNLGEGTDLIGLNQDGVCRAAPDALTEALFVCDEQVVTDKQDLPAQSRGQFCPAVKIALIQAVLDGEDGVLVHQPCPLVNQLRAGFGGTVLRQAVAVVLVVPLSGGAVQGDFHLFGRVAAFLNRAADQFQSLFVLSQIRCKAALVPDRGGKALFFQDPTERMVDFTAHPQALREGGGTHGGNHELLDFHIVGSVRTAVENVHHRDGQTFRRTAAEVAEGGQPIPVCRGTHGGKGHRQNRVGTQAGLGIGAVQIAQNAVHLLLLRGIHAAQGGGDDLSHVRYRVPDTLSAVPLLFVVAQLAGFIDSG